MSTRKQPAVSYRSSIWLFSFLLLVLFGVFSIGIGINVLKMGREWRTSELNHFLTTSNSVQTLLLKSQSGHGLMAGDFSEYHKAESAKLLRPFQLNTRDTVYLIFRNQGYIIFPVFQLVSPELLQTPPDSWHRGWEGIRSMTTEYTRNDGTHVLASVTPELFTDAGPSVLIVVERHAKVFTRIDMTVRILLGLCVLGLIFAYILVLYYGRKMTQPYSRLEAILHTVESTDSGILGELDTYQDPVQRAIETFAVAVGKLQEQRARLEILGNRLNDMVSLDSGNAEYLLTAVNAGIITFDPNCIIQSVTSQVNALLNLNNKPLVGLSSQDVFGADGVVTRSLELSFKHLKSVKNRQFLWDLPGHEPVWLSAATTVIRSDDGTIKGIGCVIRDITVLKRLKEQVREKEHLAALGELSAGIAHEFRNPLGAILGNAQYLAEELKTGENKEVALEIRNEVEGLERIIRSFLNFARPFHPEVSSVSIRKLFEDELEQIRLEYNDLINVTCQTDFENGFVEVDENLFRQAIRNVLINSCQAMGGEGTLVVEIQKPVSSKRSGHGGNRQNWIIRILDSGPGVDPESSDQLFIPFNTKREDGTGLGLAIVKKIILVHNGQVEFEANPPPGAVLRIVLPIAYDPDQTLVIRREELDF